MLEKSNPIFIFFELLFYHRLEIFLFCPLDKLYRKFKAFLLLLLPIDGHDLQYKKPLTNL